ncbi:hypothetical protein FS749_012802 [Ceratobasidium sp. UAMH 11750]|nr:hypothetical protein FS749_012802 [Ceratobasidium sp. UAMH 11750]
MHPLTRTPPCLPTRLSLALLAPGADAPALLICLPIRVRHHPSPLPTPAPETSLFARVLARTWFPSLTRSRPQFSLAHALPVVLKPVTAAPPLPQPADHYRQPQSHGYALEPMHGAPATARKPNTPLAPLPAPDPHLRHAHGHPHAYSQPAGLRGSQPAIPPDSAPGAGIHIACESGRAVANAASTRKPRAVRVREREQQLQREMSSATAD